MLPKVMTQKVTCGLCGERYLVTPIVLNEDGKGLMYSGNCSSNHNQTPETRIKVESSFQLFNTNTPPLIVLPELR